MAPHETWRGPSGPPSSLRRLVVVLGDQLNLDSAAFDGFDAVTDAVWMAEVAHESLHVASHQARTALFLSAMRHLRDTLVARGWTVVYRSLDAHTHRTLGAALAADLAVLAPAKVVAVQPGEFRLISELERAVEGCGLVLEWREDRHFMCDGARFTAWAEGRRSFRLEHFYRMMRRHSGVLMDGDEPAGGAWNYDADNRASFGRQGPGHIENPRSFAPDATTREVLELVARRFAGNPGSLEHFDWPVTRADALAALADFVAVRLPLFGAFQDAMWGGRTYLYHSRLAAALNVKLLAPGEVVAAAEQAYRAGTAPLAAVEGFVRQVLGWREYVRGLYWLRMPAFATMNALDAHAPLPAFYWTGDTEFECLKDTIGHTLTHGYAHHIERLMVTGLFALLLGVEPREVHEWYLAIYVDAVEWVELPNVLGMSQYADGGLLASKPYIASGRYIERMSDHCRRCPRRPDEATGPRACPFTTLYWDFLGRHATRFASHPRIAQQVRNLVARPAAEQAEIVALAARIRADLNPA